MQVLRILHARGLALSLGLVALLASANGCSDPNPVTAMGPEAAAAKGKAQQEARENAFGKGGAPTGKPTSPPAK
jgi:hypothetical protein